MMLWILLMGGFGAIKTDNQWWFAQLIADSCLATGIRTKAEIVFSLTEFFWTDLYLYPLFTDFWDIVSTAMEVGNIVARVDELESSEL
jgi:hypothetical protein